MISKIIFALATLCVVNASVLTVNTFDDDLETELASNPKDCNFQACAQLCRRLKFPGGSCVNGSCKCYNFRDITDPAELLSAGSCDFRECDLQCFRFGYSGGTCVNGRCKCNRGLNAEDTLTDSAEPLPLSSCNSIACDDKCRRNGWHSGVCVKGECKCDHFLYTEDSVAENTVSNLEDTESDNFFETEDASDSQFPIRICRLSKCRRKCNRRGYELAKCVDGRCKCYKKTQTKDASPLNDVTSDENEESNFILGTNEEEPTVSSPRACNAASCNQICRRFNHVGGWCRFGQCQCY